MSSKPRASAKSIMNASSGLLWWPYSQKNLTLGTTNSLSYSAPTVQNFCEPGFQLQRGYVYQRWEAVRFTGPKELP